ncbi:MAG: TonB-dependent receptor [Alphaproteobacteria bacterium]|nr:TonB-dependent receptor [Alphaproteobacteria bacterium]
MRLGTSRALCASTALASGLMLAGSALAQSTATQVQELVVTGARQAPSVNGLATQVQVAKDESVVSQQFIKTQVGSANFAQLINFLPGVTYESEDPTGILSGDFRMHGMDCSHLSVTIDGSPVNDTGNYACYPGEYLVGELTDHITVDIGSTDVDSPTASAVGGQVNIISKVPPETFGVIGKVTAGSYRYNREYGELDTGAIGPWGTRAYIAGNYARADKWKGEGSLIRRGVDARIYQPLPDNKGFVSLAGNYTSDRAYFYYSGSNSDIAKWGKSFDYNPVWIPETVTPGQKDTVPFVPTGAAAIAAGLPANAGQAGGDTNYWMLHPNPVDFGQIRGASLYHITDRLTFTFDPSFFYTLANGGGAQAISECDPRLKGSTGNCVDLNHDGDTLDTVALYSPNNTKTHRWVVTSSLLWDINDNNNLQLAYTYDYGRHRQTQDFTYINPVTGVPADQFGAKEGRGPMILTSDGKQFEGRDRFSIAELNQIALNYVGKFLDDRLHVNVGVRDPHFERKLNQFCYTYNGTNQYCTTGAPPSASIDPATGLPNVRAPFRETVRYHKLLPNAGATYRIAEDHQVYLSYSQGFSAPKTDDLYTSSPETVQPETSTTYSAGYRYQTHILTASANLYDTDYKNRIVQSYDPNDPSISIDRNVGAVRIYGVDFEAGVRPIEHLSLYGSATFQNSDIKDNVVIVVGGQTAYLPTAGKQFVLTPKRQFAGRIQYDLGELTLGFEGKYESSRFVSDVNDQSIPAYSVFNLDAEYRLPAFNGVHSSLQLKVDNIFDKTYFTRSSTVNAAHDTPVELTNGGTATYRGGNYYLYYGAPRTVYVTLSAQF